MAANAEARPSAHPGSTPADTGTGTPADTSTPADTGTGPSADADTGAPAAGDSDDGARHDLLLSRWTRLLHRCQETAHPDPAPYGEDLLARWAEPQRRYHATAHLRAVLDHVEELAHHCADPDAVRLAAWFHDAVYDPERSGNEERSARLAERALPEAGVSAARTAEVARLVRLTVGHDPEHGDADGEVLCDADLAVLAAPPRAYAAYAAEIRQEYGFVPHDAFVEGRSAVLRQLLELPSLYRTPTAHERWERTARFNLETELELLSVS